MDRFWNTFLQGYVNEPFYWFQPKGFTVSPNNLPQIKRKLGILETFAGQRWRDVQSEYTRLLEKKGLFKPRKARRGARDYAAISRMNKEIFDSLGLVWITDESVVVVTEAGRRYLETSDAELTEFVDQQLRKYEYPNPAVGRVWGNGGVFPYAEILAVLAHFPNGIPSECYEVFIARIRSSQGVADAVQDIRRYTRLNKRERSWIVKRLERIPILQAGHIVTSGRRTSLYRTIKLNRSYMLGLLKTPGVIVESDGRLCIARERYSDAEALVQDHLRSDCYIRFANAEDWVAFYGELGRRPTFAEALAYYQRRGEVEKSSEVFELGKRSQQLPKELQQLDVHEFRRLNILEKTLEDFLEFNLELLESGLRFVARQHPTPTGPLDILAQDARRRWVVIELKRGRAGDRVIGQLLRYRGFIVKDKADGKESRVRGFVVAPDPDKRLVAAAKGAKSVALEVHQFVVKGSARKVYPT